jgi:hypothetical protein
MAEAVNVFPFRFSRTYQLAAAPFGVGPRTANVRVTDAELIVRFGPWRLATSRANVVGTTVTGPYRLLKTAGPAHLSLADRGLSCITNPDRGLCITFAEPVPGIEPLGVLRHPAVTVTVADCARLAAVLAGDGA